MSDRLPFLLGNSAVPDCPICEWIRAHDANAHTWQTAFRPSESWLSRLRQVSWPASSPTFTIVMVVRATPPRWLREALESVRAQIYPKWELICVQDGPQLDAVKDILAEASASDSRITTIALPKPRGVAAASNAGLRQAKGDYVCVLGESDALEPHALHRFAEAVLADAADFLYSDELVCREDLDHVLRVAARPQFSYDHYLSHPYFVHLIAVRTALARAVDGFDESTNRSYDVDFVLRVLEQSTSVSHVPDLLYRWRTIPSRLERRRQDLAEDSTTSAVRRHLTRLGYRATVTPTFPNVRDVAFAPSGPSKVAIVIPTKNHAELLRACVTSVERTVRPDIADIFVVDHQSDDPDTRQYLSELSVSHHALSYQGKFNYSAMMNHAVRQLPDRYSHYLFLNNDVEATSTGWLEHMLGLGHREEVAAVGATLLYPDGRIQHAGVVIGLQAGAEHVGRFLPCEDADGTRAMGHNAMLVSNRDVSAVTAACMLFNVEAFKRLNGFDERLAVGFGDTDLCLRAIGAGYKVLMDAHATLTHHESGTRGTPPDSHPKDSRLFVKRWRKLIRAGDPRYTPYLSLDTHGMELNLGSRPAKTVRPRTVVLTWKARRPSGPLNN